MAKLGDVVKDRITGYKGTVVAKTLWLYGCIRVGVQSKRMKDGKPVEAQWFDEGQVDVLSKALGGPNRPHGAVKDPSR